MMLNNFNENTVYNSNNHVDDTNLKEPATVLPQRPSAVQTIEPIRSTKPAAATAHLPPTTPHSWGPYPTHQLDGFLNGCYPTGNPHQPVYAGVDQYKSNSGKYHTAAPHAHAMQHDYHHYTTQYPGGTIHHPIPVKCNEVCCQHLPDPPRYHPPPPTFQFPPHHIQPPRYSEYHHHHHHHHNPANGISKQYLYNNKKNNKTASSGVTQPSNSSFSPVHSDLQSLPKYSHHHYHQVASNRQKELKQPAKPVALETAGYPVYPVMNSYWASRGWVPPPPPPYHQAVPLAQYKTKQDATGSIHCTPAFQTMEHNVTPTNNMNEERKGVIMNSSNSGNNNSSNNSTLGGIPKSVNDYHEKSTSFRTDCFDLSTSFINSGFPPIVHNSTNKITINNITTTPIRQSTHSQSRNINLPCQLMGIDKQQIPVVQSELQVNVSETSNLAQLDTPPATHCINVLSSSPNGSNFMINDSTNCNPINYSISNNEMFNNVGAIPENVKHYESQNDPRPEHLASNLTNPDSSIRSLPKKQPDLDVRQFLVTWNDTDEDSTRMSESQNNHLNITGTSECGTNNSIDDVRHATLSHRNTSMKNNASWSNSQHPVQARHQLACKSNNSRPVMNVIDTSSVVDNTNNYGISNRIFNKKLHPDGEVCISAVPKRVTPLDAHSNMHPSYIEGYMDPKNNSEEKKALLQNSNICRSASRIMHDSCVDKGSHFPFYNGFSNFIREKNDTNMMDNAPFYSAFNEPTSQHSCPAIRQHLASWEHINNTINETDHSAVTIDRKIISANIQKDGFERKNNVNVVEPIIPIPNRNSLMFEKEMHISDKRRNYTGISALDEDPVGNFYNDPAINAIHQRSIIDNSCNFIDLSSNNGNNLSHNSSCGMHSDIQQSFPHDRTYLGYKTGVICENNPNKCMFNSDAPKFLDNNVLKLPQQITTSKEDLTDSQPGSNESRNDSIHSKESGFPNAFIPVNDSHKTSYTDNHEKSLSEDSPAINFTCTDGNSNAIINVNDSSKILNTCPSNIVDPILQDSVRSNTTISSPLSVGSHCNTSNHSNFPDVSRKADQEKTDSSRDPNSFTPFLHQIPSTTHSSDSLINAFATESKHEKVSEKEDNTITLHSASDITTHITVNDCSTYVRQYSEMEESLNDKIIKDTDPISDFNGESSQTCKDKSKEHCSTVLSPSTTSRSVSELPKDESPKSIANDNNNNSNIVKMKLNNRIIKKKLGSSGLKLKRLTNSKQWVKMADQSCSNNTTSDCITKNIIISDTASVSLLDTNCKSELDLSSDRRHHVGRVLSMPSLEDSPSPLGNNHASEIGEEIEGLIAAEQNNSRQSFDCNTSSSIDKELEKPFLKLGNTDNLDVDPKRDNKFEMCRIDSKDQVITHLDDLSACHLNQAISKTHFINNTDSHLVGICTETNAKAIDDINILQKKLNSINSLEDSLESCYSSNRLHSKIHLDLDLSNCNQNKSEIVCPTVPSQIDYTKPSETNRPSFDDNIDSSNNCNKSSLKYCNSPSMSYFKLNKNNSVESHHCDNDAEVDEVDYDEERLISSVECTPGSPNVEELFEDINKPTDDFTKPNYNLDIKSRENDKSVNVDDFHLKPHCDLISNTCLKINHDCKINNKESVIKSTLNTIENSLVEDDYRNSTFHCDMDVGCDVSTLSYNKSFDNIDSVTTDRVNPCSSLFNNDEFIARGKLSPCKFDESVSGSSKDNVDGKEVFHAVPSLLLPHNDSSNQNISSDKDEPKSFLKSATSTAHSITENNSVITECNKEDGFDIDSLCDLNLTQSNYHKPENDDKEAVDENNHNGSTPKVNLIDEQPNFQSVLSDDLNIVINLSKEINIRSDNREVDRPKDTLKTVSNSCQLVNDDSNNVRDKSSISDCVGAVNNFHKTELCSSIVNESTTTEICANVTVNYSDDSKMSKSVVHDLLADEPCGKDKEISRSLCSEISSHESKVSKASRHLSEDNHGEDLSVALSELEDHIATDVCNLKCNDPSVNKSVIQEDSFELDEIDQQIDESVKDTSLPLAPSRISENQDVLSTTDSEDETSSVCSSIKESTVVDCSSEFVDVLTVLQSNNSVKIEGSDLRTFSYENDNNCRNIIVNNKLMMRETVIHDDSVKNNTACISTSKVADSFTESSKDLINTISTVKPSDSPASNKDIVDNSSSPSGDYQNDNDHVTSETSEKELGRKSTSATENLLVNEAHASSICSQNDNREADLLNKESTETNSIAVKPTECQIVDKSSLIDIPDEYTDSKSCVVESDLNTPDNSVPNSPNKDITSTVFQDRKCDPASDTCDDSGLPDSCNDSKDLSSDLSQDFRSDQEIDNSIDCIKQDELCKEIKSNICKDESEFRSRDISTTDETTLISINPFSKERSSSYESDTYNIESDLLEKSTDENEFSNNEKKSVKSHNDSSDEYDLFSCIKSNDKMNAEPVDRKEKSDDFKSVEDQEVIRNDIERNDCRTDSTSLQLLEMKAWSRISIIEKIDNSENSPKSDLVNSSKKEFVESVLLNESNLKHESYPNELQKECVDPLHRGKPSERSSVEKDNKADDVSSRNNPSGNSVMETLDKSVDNSSASLVNDFNLASSSKIIDIHNVSVINRCENVNDKCVIRNTDVTDEPTSHFSTELTNKNIESNCVIFSKVDLVNEEILKNPVVDKNTTETSNEEVQCQPLTNVEMTNVVAGSNDNPSVKEVPMEPDLLEKICNTSLHHGDKISCKLDSIDVKNSIKGQTTDNEVSDENKVSRIDGIDYEEQVPRHIINLHTKIETTSETTSNDSARRNIEVDLTPDDFANSATVVKYKNTNKLDFSVGECNKSTRMKTEQVLKRDRLKLKSNCKIINRRRQSKIYLFKHYASSLSRRDLKNSSRKYYLKAVKNSTKKSTKKLNLKLNMHLSTSSQESKFIKNNKKRKVILEKSSNSVRKCPVKPRENSFNSISKPLAEASTKYNAIENEPITMAKESTSNIPSVIHSNINYSVSQLGETSKSDVLITTNNSDLQPKTNPDSELRSDSVIATAPKSTEQDGCSPAINNENFNIEMDQVKEFSKSQELANNVVKSSSDSIETEPLQDELSSVVDVIDGSKSCVENLDNHGDFCESCVDAFSTKQKQSCFENERHSSGMIRVTTESQELAHNLVMDSKNSIETEPLLNEFSFQSVLNVDDSESCVENTEVSKDCFKTTTDHIPEERRQNCLESALYHSSDMIEHRTESQELGNNLVLGFTDSKETDPIQDESLPPCVIDDSESFVENSESSSDCCKPFVDHISKEQRQSCLDSKLSYLSDVESNTVELRTESQNPSNNIVLSYTDLKETDPVQDESSSCVIDDSETCVENTESPNDCCETSIDLIPKGRSCFESELCHSSDVEADIVGVRTESQELTDNLVTYSTDLMETKPPEELKDEDDESSIRVNVINDPKSSVENTSNPSNFCETSADRISRKRRQSCFKYDLSQSSDVESDIIELKRKRKDTLIDCSDALPLVEKEDEEVTLTNSKENIIPLGHESPSIYLKTDISDVQSREEENPVNCQISCNPNIDLDSSDSSNTYISPNTTESQLVTLSNEIKRTKINLAKEAAFRKDDVSVENDKEFLTQEDKELNNCSEKPENAIKDVAKRLTVLANDIDLAKENEEKFIEDSEHMCVSGRTDTDDKISINPDVIIDNADVLTENESIAISDIINYTRIVEANGSIIRSGENDDSNSEVRYNSENKLLPVINVDDSNNIVIIIEELCNSENKIENSSVDDDQKCTDEKVEDNELKLDWPHSLSEVNKAVDSEIKSESEKNSLSDNFSKLSATNLYEEKQFVADVLDEFTVAEVEVSTNTYCEASNNCSDDSSDEDFLGYNSCLDKHEEQSNHLIGCSIDNKDEIVDGLQSESKSFNIYPSKTNANDSKDVSSIAEESVCIETEKVDKEDYMPQLCDMKYEKEAVYSESVLKVINKPYNENGNIQQIHKSDDDDRRFDIISISPTISKENDAGFHEDYKFTKPVIKCSLPWERVFNTTHSKKRKIVRKPRRSLTQGIEFGPAKIELRVGSGEQHDDVSGKDTAWKVVGNNLPSVNASVSVSPVVKVRRLILQRDPELTSYSEDSACSSKEYLSSSSDEEDKVEKRFSSSSSSVSTSSSVLFEDGDGSSGSSRRIIKSRRSSCNSTCSSRCSSSSNSSSNVSSAVTSATSIPKVLIKKMKQSEYKSFLKISHTFNKPVVKLIRCDLIDSLALKNKTSINLCNKVVNDTTNEFLYEKNVTPPFTGSDEMTDYTKKSTLPDDFSDVQEENYSQKSLSYSILTDDNSITNYNNSDFESGNNDAYEFSSCRSKSPLSLHSKSTFHNCDTMLENNEDSIQGSALSNYDTTFSISSKEFGVKVEQMESGPSSTVSKLKHDENVIEPNNDSEAKLFSNSNEHQTVNRGIAVKRTSDDVSSGNESSTKKRLPKDVTKYMFHCQRCLLVFNNKEEVITHQAAMHPSHQELHHCMLCQRSFSSLTRHTLHIQSRSHRRLELMQRCTIHAMHRYFTGRDCPRLYPLTPAELKSFDWRPNQPGCIHFYHHPSPLQLALQENPWGMKSKINSDQFSSTSSSSSRASSPAPVTNRSSSSVSLSLKSPPLSPLTSHSVDDSCLT